MANSSVVLSTLDFNSLKANLKQYLQSQSIFKDYNFDGSNMSVLLDVMSYNTYLNAFYLNMVASEMFLDSAQKYDSVISHAKELNYIPNSAKSSSSEITLNVVASNTGGTLTVPKGTRFSGTNSNGSFIFTTDESTTVVSSASGNNNFTVSNLQIYEGNYFTDTYVMNYNIENQQFLMSNRNADTSSLSVTITENAGSTNTAFKQARGLVGLNSNSSVYFLQAAQDGLYEIVFGENLFGRKPLNGAIITMNYRVAAGPSADGVNKFSLVSDLGPNNGSTIDTSSVTTVSNSSGGSSQESIESVRFAAPRYFATQQRAVTSDDYSSLILSNFGEQISDVLVYGGQESEPKKYGRVIVAVKPSSGTIAPNYVKDNISNYLRDLVALPNRVEIEDPDYAYCSVVSRVQYDENITTRTASEIKTSVINNIVNYSKNNLEKFDNDLRYSKVVSIIDGSDPSIVSNQTDLRLIKRLSPTLNTNEKYSIKTFNPIFYTSTVYTPNSEHTALHSDPYSLHSEHTSILSSTFTYNSTDGNSYPLSFIEEDQRGNLRVFSPIGNELIVTDVIGTVNYVTGEIVIARLNAADYNNYISLYIRTETSDLIAKQNKILIIDPSDINVEMLGKME